MKLSLVDICYSQEAFYTEQGLFVTADFIEYTERVPFDPLNFF